jgi:PAS domain S-box-containing protein
MDMKAEPTPFEQKLFLVFIVTFAAMMAFEFAMQFLYPYPPDWRSNLVTSFFVSGLAVIVAYFPLNSYYARNVEILSEMERRRSVEMKLRESEEKYRILADNATDIVWIFDLATRKFTYFSPSVKKIRGFTPEEALELPLEKTLAPESYTRAMAELRETLELDKQHLVEHDRIRVFEFQEFCKDGSIISTETRMKFIRNADGIPTGLQGITRDVTERKRVEEALKESEDFNRGLVENMPDIVTVYGHDRKIRYANQAVTRMLGYSTEEVVGTDMMDYLVPEQRAEIAAVISERLATGNTKSVEVEILGKEGQRLTVITKGTPVRYHTEPAVLLVLTDISERKAMESAYRAMVRSMVGTTGLNSLQKITENVSSWLGADCVMVGEIQPDNQTVKVLSMFLDGKQVADFSYTLKGTPCDNVAEKGFCLYPDNVTRLFPESRDLARLNIRGYIGTPLRNSGGQVFGILCALSRSPIQSFPSVREIMDIIAVKAAAEIERTQMERALRESEEKFRMVVENTLDGILIVAMTGMVLFRNQALANIFDVEREPYWPGTKNVLEFIAPESRSQVLHDFSQVAQGIDSYPVNYQAITATGRRIWIESIGKRIQFQNSPAILVSMRDVSSRKRMEEAILRTNRQLNLLSSITRHDINNQLQVLNGFVELLHMKMSDSSFEYCFSRIMEASSRITAMIRFTKEFEEIGVHASVWQDLQTLVNSAAKGVTLGQVTLKNDLPPAIEVFADPLIVRVFFNLIDNALRHGGKITTIRFSFEARNGNRIIVCEDDGDGVVNEEKERIFDRGFGKNTGFGLAISREILDITGITIKETGEPGRGARFEIMVPKEAYRVVDAQKNL